MNKRRQARLPAVVALGLIVLLGPAGAVTASSETPPTAPPATSPFSIHDLDRDGLLSRDEYHRFLAGVERRRQSARQGGRSYPPPLRFDEIDNNGDGYLNEDEMTSALNRRLERHKRYRGGRW